MQSLTSYQVNRNGVRRQAVRKGTAEAASMNHSQTIKSTRPEQKESMTQDSTRPGMKLLTL